MPKLQYGKPEFPLYMEPNITISNYTIDDVPKLPDYHSETINIASFEDFKYENLKR